MNKNPFSVIIHHLIVASLLVPALCRAMPEHALTFDGINDYVETNTEVIPTSGNFTVEFWAECPAAPASYREIISQGTGGNQFYIGTDLSNNIRVGAWIPSPAVPYPVGGWHHFALVRSSTDTDFFIDGILKASRGSALANPAAATGLRLGRQNSTGGEYWPGSIGDVRVWSRDLGYEELDQALTGGETELLAWWKFDEGAGSTCRSTSKAGFVGTLMNGPFWTGKSTLALTSPATALGFDGTNDYVETGTSVIPSSGDFTVEVWAECPSAPNSYREIISQGGSGNAFYIGTTPSNTIRVGDTWGTLSPAVPMPIGGWHHFAVVKTSANTLLYIDGVLKASRGSAISNPASSGLRFGQQYGYVSPEYWPGNIGDVRVWNRALAYQQLGVSLTGSEANLVSWWRFNEATGTTCRSVGSMTVVGTLTNGPVWTNPSLIFTDFGTGVSIIGSSPSLAGELEIPGTINGKPVTVIAYQAFLNHTGLTSVTIPASVTSIGGGAFYGCAALASAEFPGNAPAMEKEVFDATASGFLIKYHNTSTGFSSPAWLGYPSVEVKPQIVVEQPAASPLTNGTSTVDYGMDGNIGIAARTFAIRNAGQLDLTDFVVTISGPNAAEFAVDWLPAIILYPGGSMEFRVTFTPVAVGSHAAVLHLVSNDVHQSPFDVNLTAETTLYAFTDDGTSITITGINFQPVGALDIPAVINGKPVTRIADTAFLSCSGLTSVTIPPSVSSIGQAAFAYCTTLTAATIPASVTKIEAAVFQNCSKLASVTMPSSVTSIGGFAFVNCTALPSLTLPSSVTSIGDSAFANCTGLSSLTIPEGVTDIGVKAFYNCPRLTSVTIPSSVMSLGESAFMSCTGLKSLTILEGAASIGKAAFQDCRNLISVTIPGSVSSIGTWAFGYCSGLTSVTILWGVTSIESSAFYSCSGLSSVVIPTSVTRMKYWAFRGCSSLKSVMIPTSVTVLESRVFEGCSGLTSVTIPSSVTGMENFVFDGCSGLTSAEFLGNAPTVGNSVFNGAASGFKIIYHGTTSGFTSPTWHGYACEMAAAATYASWQASSFTPTDIATGQTTMEADFDHDGISNMLECAFGGNPKVSDITGIAPTSGMAGNKLQIAFKCDAAYPQLIYTVQASTTLAPDSWTDIATSVGGATTTPIGTCSTVTDTGSGRRTVTVTDATAPPEGGRPFMRVMVTAP